jgi:Na+/H+ antiporter NhaC
LTGSSWATMGILLPVVVPLAAPLAAVHPAWLLAATAAVLDGAIFGDHCSPLSDTTVMSSAAAGVSHDEHVWTQIPYALLVMIAVAIFGYIGVAVFDWAPWQGLLLAVGCIAGLIRLLGVKPVAIADDKTSIIPDS